MTTQRPTTRMQRRIEAINAVSQSFLPGFCQDMKCDSTCPCFKPGAESNCGWMQILNDVKRMHVKLKYKEGIVID